MKKLFFIIPILLLGCSEFLSPDVSEGSLTILSPQDSIYTSAEKISFWWDKDPMAESYRLQVVRPDFDNPLEIIDTLLSTNLLSLNLSEGRYTWRIRMENEASVSPWQQRNSFVDRTPPLRPTILYPPDSAVLSKSIDSFVLKWQSADHPLDQMVFPVSDSVFLYQDGVIIGSEIFPGGSNREWDVSSFLLGVTQGDTLGYLFEIRSKDIAQNKNLISRYLLVLD